MDIYPSLTEFKRLTRRGNLIPVWTRMLADVETPVSAFLKLGIPGPSFLLESVENQEKLGRYSFVGFGPSRIFRSKNRSATWTANGRVRHSSLSGDPLEELRSASRRLRVVRDPRLPRFAGGWVGMMGYDAVRFFEDLPDTSTDDLKLDDAVWMLADQLVAFDHYNRTMQIILHVPTGVSTSVGSAYRNAERRLGAIIRRLNHPPARVSALRVTGPARSTETPASFQRKVQRAKSYIQAGDVIQVVLSQRWAMEVQGHPFSVYRRLRTINPSPYMFYLDLGEIRLVGSSPELLVRKTDRLVETRPIAGTRPRGRTPAEDEQLGRQLLADPKERAEHIMLVDLGRNDLGRVCQTGSIRVSDLMRIERFSHVMHIVSDVTGKLRGGRDGFDLIRAAFPAGTVAGAPKVRAMEIIEELEGRRRGAYAGLVGYFDFTGNLDTCITIRTILFKGRKAYIQTGAGIVADSRPRREYQESVNKAKALMAALKSP